MFPGMEDDGVTAFRILKRFHAVPTAWPAVANASWVASPAFSPYLNRPHETIFYPNFVFFNRHSSVLTSWTLHQRRHSKLQRATSSRRPLPHPLLCLSRTERQGVIHIVLDISYILPHRTLCFQKRLAAAGRALTDGVKRCQDDLAGHGGEECSPLLGADQRRRHGPGHRDDRVEQRLAHLLGHLRQLPDPELINAISKACY